MAMTDTDLCRDILGWTHGGREGWIDSDGMWQFNGNREPDFAHNMDAAMKLARATELKYGCLLTLCSYFLRRGTKGRVYDMVFRFPSGPEDTILGRATSEPEDAIRAAVVNVCEAHATKGDTDGEA